MRSDRVVIPLVGGGVRLELLGSFDELKSIEDRGGFKRFGILKCY